MRNYSGKANTLDAAIRQAAETAVADIGPDALVSFSLEEVRGMHGGIAGLHEIEASITVRVGEGVPKCKEALDYQAYQKDGVVTVLAFGQHPSAGYEVALELSPIDIFPPQYILTHLPPSGPVAQVITPFVVSAGFRADDPIEVVIVEDGKGKQEIVVKQFDTKQEARK